MHKNVFKVTFYGLLISSLFSCNNKNSYYDLKDFAIKDTSKIIKFKISDTENNSIVISRNVNSNKWVLEGSKYTANKSSVDLLMETFYRIRVKQDVPKSALNTVINRLSVRHKKVEVFFENELEGDVILINACELKIRMSALKLTSDLDNRPKH